MARGQEAIDRGQEELCQANQRVAAATNPPTPVILVVHIPVGPSVGVPPSLGGGPVNQNDAHSINTSVLVVNDLNDAFFSPRDESVYDVVGPTGAEIERKLCVIKEKVKAMDGSNAYGLDAVEMCLVPGV